MLKDPKINSKKDVKARLDEKKKALKAKDIDPEVAKKLQLEVKQLEKWLKDQK